MRDPGMSPRENLLRAIRRQRPQHVPCGMVLCPAQIDAFEQRYGHRDYPATFGLPYRYVRIGPTRSQPDYSSWYPNLPEGTSVDEWGIARESSQYAHFIRFVPGMADLTTPEEVFAWPEPDVDADYRWQDLPAQVAALHNQDLAAIFYSIQIFEPAWYLRGLDNLLADMMVDEEMAEACLTRMIRLKVRIAARAAASGVDGIIFGDDVGAQNSMMISPEDWRRWLKPGLAEAIAAAKARNPEVFAYYHSDGWIEPIIPDLIDIGVDVLNPVQPESMDPVKIKREFGDRLAFWGTIGTQTVMPFGTPEEIRENVRDMIRTVGAGGGLVIAPTHVIEPEVPWENIEAFLQAVRDYG